MEIMVAYWWIVKLLITVIFGVSLYKMIKSKFKSKFWILIFIMAFILQVIAPVKIGVNTTQNQNTSDYSIENMRKNVPEKVQDNSFKESTKLQGIKESDLK